MGEIEIFSTRIKELRESLQMTQTQFSGFIGVKQQTLSGYERGIMKPPLDVAKIIAQKCHVSIDWLCGLTDKQSYNDEIVTYADMFRLIIKLTKTNSFFGDWNIIFENNNPFNDPNLKDVNFACLRNDDKTIADFFKDWEQMEKLYRKFTIDEHLYDLWLSDKLKRFENERLCPISNDDRLPFEDDAPHTGIIL